MRLHAEDGEQVSALSASRGARARDLLDRVRTDAAPVGRVVHVVQPTEAAGLAFCVADLTRLQVQRGWEAVLVSPSGPLVELCSAAGARVVRWDASREPGLSLVDEIVGLARILRRERPAIVHLHSSKAGLVGRTVVRGSLPTVFSPHAWSFEHVSGVMRKLVSMWERQAARWADRILCVSEDERRTGERAGVRAQWAVLPNEVDISASLPALGDTRELRRRLGVSSQAAVAVCVGRICHQKGQDVLLQAWPRVAERVPNAQLVLVGDGPDRPTLERAASRLPGVRWVGSVSREQSLRWMAASDVVVAPSRWEGMALVPLEAISLGRPIVAASAEGMTSVVRSGAGTVVPVGVAAPLADALSTYLADPALRDRATAAARMLGAGRAGRLEANGDKLSHLYLEVLQARRRPDVQGLPVSG